MHKVVNASQRPERADRHRTGPRREKAGAVNAILRRPPNRSRGRQPERAVCGGQADQRLARGREIRAGGAELDSRGRHDIVIFGVGTRSIRESGRIRESGTWHGLGRFGVGLRQSGRDPGGRFEVGAGSMCGVEVECIRSVDSVPSRCRVGGDSGSLRENPESTWGRRGVDEEWSQGGFGIEPGSIQSPSAGRLKECVDGTPSA